MIQQLLNWLWAREVEKWVPHPNPRAVALLSKEIKVEIRPVVALLADDIRQNPEDWTTQNYGSNGYYVENNRRDIRLHVYFSGLGNGYVTYSCPDGNLSFITEEGKLIKEALDYRRDRIVNKAVKNLESKLNACV